MLAFPFNVPYPDAGAVSAVLSGKVLAQGDRVSLLPQDYTRVPNGQPQARSSLSDALGHLRSVLGENWKYIDLWVGEVEPGPLAIATPSTTLDFTRQTTQEATTVLGVARLEDLGGLEAQIRLFQEWLTVSFDGTEVLARMGLDAPDGILTYGPPGSGKSSLVAAMAARLGAEVSVVYGAHLASWNANQAGDHLRKVVRSISPPPPQILLIEDIDRLVPNPHLHGPPNPIAPVLIDELRACDAHSRVAIVATTNDRSLLDPEILGPKLLENELEIPVPREKERLAILSIHTRSMPLAPDVSLADLAARTAGFVGADLRLLCQKAAAASIAGRTSSEVATHVVSHKDFLAALGQIRPSAVADRQAEIGGVTFEDVGDMEEVKSALEETVLWPLRFPETMRRYKLDSPRGILLYGPPGCGKTYVMRALAGESGAAFFASDSGVEVHDLRSLVFDGGLYPRDIS